MARPSPLGSAELYDPASGTWTIPAGLTPHALITRRPCCQMAWSLFRGTGSRRFYLRERGTVRPGDRDLDCDRQPKHPTQ